jgi:hypothetical protein
MMLVGGKGGAGYFVGRIEITQQVLVILQVANADLQLANLKRVQPFRVLHFDSRCWCSGVAVGQLKFYNLYKVSDRGEVVEERQAMLSAVSGPGAM